MTIVLGRVSRGGDYADEESNGAANKHTAMGLWGGVPVTGSWLRVPQDSQVARRGRGIHHQVQRLQVAERPTALYKPGWACLVMASYLVPPCHRDLVGKMSAMAIMLLSDTNSLSFVKPVRRSFV